jgi:hypothetical protein
MKLGLLRILFLNGFYSLGKPLSILARLIERKQTETDDCNPELLWILSVILETFRYRFFKGFSGDTKHIQQLISGFPRAINSDMLIQVMSLLLKPLTF